VTLDHNVAPSLLTTKRIGGVGPRAAQWWNFPRRMRSPGRSRWMSCKNSLPGEPLRSSGETAQSHVSTDFLRGRETGHLTNHAYPHLLQDVAGCLRQPAGPHGDLKASDLATLEKEHHAYLLALVT
jgi:hypothetical protein